MNEQYVRSEPNRTVAEAVLMVVVVLFAAVEKCI
jgi:hypothetical protein